MPMYEYACDSCTHRFEVEQSMRDEPLTVCPQCTQRIRRVFGLNSVIFKGDGFYCTDTRQKATKEASSPCASCPASS